MRRRSPFRIYRNQDGSIPITLGVMVVSSVLVVALLDVANFGLRLSRRSGDSANALQLADAGINDAVKAVAASVGPTITNTIDLGSAGSYTYEATLDGASQVWHIVATGVDRTGMKRRIKADAAGESMFANAFFVQATANLQSGASVDSFKNGSTAQNMCTRKGTIGSNSPGSMSFGNNGVGSGVRNCTQTVYGVSWPHPVDGCVAYGEDGTQPFPPIGAGKCPTQPDTRKETPLFGAPTIEAPSPTATSQPVCNAANPIIGGQRYYWNSVRLGDGCFVDARNGPAVIFTKGAITIGTTPNGNKVNPPPPTAPSNIANNAGLCPATPAGLQDTYNNPASYYCPSWASTLQIYKVSGTPGEVFFENHVKFWGLIVAPSATIFSESNGSPQVEMWGSFIANEASTAAQLTLHYDESLALMTTGRFTLRNWREEPVNG